MFNPIRKFQEWQFERKRGYPLNLHERIWKIENQKLATCYDKNDPVCHDCLSGGAMMGARCERFGLLKDVEKTLEQIRQNDL